MKAKFKKCKGIDGAVICTKCIRYDVNSPTTLINKLITVNNKDFCMHRVLKEKDIKRKA